jgi:hypothetical protein
LSTAILQKNIAKIAESLHLYW